MSRGCCREAKEVGVEEALTTFISGSLEIMSQRKLRKYNFALRQEWSFAEVESHFKG